MRKDVKLIANDNGREFTLKFDEPEYWLFIADFSDATENWQNKYVKVYGIKVVFMDYIYESSKWRVDVDCSHNGIGTNRPITDFIPPKRNLK